MSEGASSQVHLCIDRGIPFTPTMLKFLARPFLSIVFRIFRNTTHKDTNGWYIASKESNPDAG